MRPNLSVLEKLENLRLNEDQLYYTLTIFTGVSAGLVAVGIHHGVSWLTHALGTHDIFTVNSFLYGGIIITISAILTYKIFPNTSGSGVPNVKVALAVHHGRISWKDWTAKIYTSILTLGSGLSMGREGPTVAIAGGMGSSLARYFNLPKRKIKGMVAVGCAGGIAAAFNTPIAAVVFTLEEIVGDLNASKMLGPVVISSVVASVTAMILHGGIHPTFTFVQYEFKDPSQLFIYFSIGILCALLGPLWVKSLLRYRAFVNENFKNKKILIALLTFIIVGLLSYVTPSVLGSGHQIINDALMSKVFSWKTLGFLFIFKFVAVTLSYATGLSGGIFMPTLFLGAMAGGLLGVLSTHFYNNISSIGPFALVGMGAFFAAVMRAPFTSILMIFEMTHDYMIILPLMVANITAYTISARLHKGSIYESLSEQDGIHLPTREDDEVLDNLLVEEAMIKDVICLDGNKTLNECLKDCRGKISGYPVMRHGRMVGMIANSEINNFLAKGFGDQKIMDLCPKNVISIYPDQSLLVAFHLIKKFQVSRLPVVSRLNDRMLVGLITPEDIACHFGYHIQDNDAEITTNAYQGIDRRQS